MSGGGSLVRLKRDAQGLTRYGAMRPGQREASTDYVDMSPERVRGAPEAMKRTADYSLLAAVRTGNRSQIGDRVPDRTRWLWLPPSITVTGTGSLTNRTVATRSEFVVPECGGIVLVGDGGR